LCKGAIEEDSIVETITDIMHIRKALLNGNAVLAEIFSRFLLFRIKHINMKAFINGCMRIVGKPEPPTMKGTMVDKVGVVTAYNRNAL
jgi:hypothetical protein